MRDFPELLRKHLGSVVRLPDPLPTLKASFTAPSARSFATSWSLCASSVVRFPCLAGSCHVLSEIECCVRYVLHISSTGAV